MKNNSLKDFKNLNYIELLKLKNYIKYYMQNPLNAIQTFIKSVLPIVFFVFMTCSNSKANKYNIYSPNFYNIGHGIGAFIMLVLIIILFYSLNSSIKKFNPSQFKIEDVHYLFPSPISPRVIYAFTIFRSTISGLVETIMFAVFYAVASYRYFHYNMYAVVSMIIGVTFISLFFKNLKFFINSLCNKFNARRKIKIIIYFLEVVFVGYILYSTKFNATGSVLNRLITVLDGDIMSNFTIIGFAKTSILYGNMGGSAPVLELIALIVITNITIILTVYFADDYYQEASECIEEKNEKLDLIYKSNTNLRELEDETFNKELKKGVRAKELTGAFSFIWKDRLIDKKKREGKKKLVINLVFIVIGSSMCYFAKGNIKLALLMYGITFCNGFLFIKTTTEYIKYELKKHYIYMIPGKLIYKVMSICFTSIITKMVGITSFCIPFAIVFYKNIDYIIYMWIVVNVLNLLNIFIDSILIIKYLETNMNSIFYIISIVVNAIPIAIPLVIFFATKMLVLAIAVFILICAILFWTMYILFKKVMN